MYISLPIKYFSNDYRIDDYGFERHGGVDCENYTDFLTDYLKVLVDRSRKWERLLMEGKSINRTSTVKRYVRKGIPSKYIFRT